MTKVLAGTTQYKIYEKFYRDLYRDDIIVSGVTLDDSIQNLRKVLQRLDHYNIRANLGYHLSGEGVRPLEITTDASPYGCGAALSHVIDGCCWEIKILRGKWNQAYINTSTTSSIQWNSGTSVAKVKRSLEKQLSTKKLTAEKIQFSLNNFLLKHRITPNSVTGYAPAEFLLKRIARTKLDLLKPTKYKRTHDTLKEMSSTDKMFVEGEEVLVWNKRNNDKKWITGKIAKQVNPFTYLVNVNCELRFVHAEDLKVNQPPTWRFPVCPLPTRKDKVEATPNGTLPQTKTDVSESIPTSRFLNNLQAIIFSQ
ncbi:hypothetical protein QE152_g10027, partial [Popillia japonica]